MKTENIPAVKTLLEQHTKISEFLKEIKESKQDGLIEINATELKAKFIGDDITHDLVSKLNKKIVEICRDTIRDIELELEVM